MSLIYRGQTAPPSTLANTARTNRLGRFMGATFTFRAPQKTTAKLDEPLQYRGVIY